jgi:hypothetical protein
MFPVIATPPFDPISKNLLLNLRKSDRAPASTHNILPSSVTACPQDPAMNDWQEINRLTKDPQAVRSMAKRLLKLPYVTWSEERLRFLKDMARERELITTRQAEYLTDLRNETELHSTAGGFSVTSLTEDCWRNREPDRYRGLSDDDVDFIERIRGKTALPRRALLRLFACCRQLGLIEEYIDIAA